LYNHPVPVFQSTRPRGARRLLSPWNALSLSFNPRAHAGRDSSIAFSICWPSVFQSTRPRGARPTQVFDEDCPVSFNPRAHAGRDTAATDKVHKVYVSIHAPTRGATQLQPQPDSPVVFQSTRPRGARHGKRHGRVYISRFQSTRPRGARLRLCQFRPSPDFCFNPRAHAGRD